MEHQIRFCITGTSKFSTKGSHFLPAKEKEVFLLRTLSSGSQNGIGVFSDRGRRTTNWLGPWKVPSNYGCCWKGMPYLPNFYAKIDSTITKYIGHNFTKVTTFIIIIIRNDYKNCYLGKIICEGSMV